MPVVFLSHSGIDTDAAWALKRRILDAAPHGLDVWFDKDDLVAGDSWQRQIEAAIERSSCFAVYVGSRGVVNWVEAEVRLALERAIAEPGYRFIPVFADAAPGPHSLPGFARQFQGVPESQFEKLLAAVLGTVDSPGPAPELEPFFGLRAIDESRSHLFFGRQVETEELLRRVFERPIVLVSGDSGSGKSSLVRAGLVPKFRGGGLAALRGERPGDRIWHVVVMRPRGRPWSELGDAVDEAAKRLGLSVSDRSALADSALSGDPEKARRALRCGLPAEETRVLLVVDQFEELFTATPEAERERFVRFLLALAAPADERFKVVLTMRHDYVNLCNSFEDLRRELDADGRRARFVLGRMTDAGLESIVTEPLRLAQVDESDRLVLAHALRDEVGTRPGDLALVQMALTETWRERNLHDGNLLAAYAAVGRVEGSLAKAAEDVRMVQLQTAARSGLAPLLDAVLVRLVRLGDTGGATRRLASRDEFDEPRWQLVQLLASEEGKRLVLLGGSDEQPTAEIAHEALVTAWPHFQNLLQSVAEDKRILDAVIPKAREWAAAATAGERRRRLVAGAELEWFGRLFRERSDWLSSTERDFIAASQVEADRQQRRDRRLRWGAWATAGLLGALLLFAMWQYDRARDALDRGNRSMGASLWNRLDFRNEQGIEPDELNALWELRLASPGLREAAFQELRPNLDRAARFGRAPGLVQRAFFLRWSDDQTAAIFDSFLQAVARTTDRNELDEFGNALNALATGMSPAQAHAALAPATRALGAATEPLQVRAFGLLRWTLTGQLSPQDARLELPSMLKTLQTTTDPYQLQSAAWAIQALHSDVTATEGQMALGAVLKAIEELKRSAIATPALRSTLQALPNQTAAQAEAALAPLQTNAPAEDPVDSLTALMSAVQALAPMLQREQAVSALGVMLQELEVPSVSSDRFRLAAIGSAVQALAQEVTADDAQAALKSLTAAIARGGVKDQRLFQPGVFPPSIGAAMSALANRLTPDQAQAGFTPLMKEASDSSDPARMLTLGSVMRAVAGKLTAEQAQVAITTVMSKLPSTFDLVARQALADAVPPLAEALTGKPAVTTLMAVLSRMQASNDPIELQVLAAAVRPLAGALTAEQAKTALTTIAKAAGDSPEQSAREEAFRMAVAGVISKLSVEEARAIVVPLWQSLAAKADTNLGDLTAMSQTWITLRAIPGWTTEEQSQAAVALFLKTLAATTDPEVLLTQGNILTLLAEKMNADQAQAAFSTALKAMANAPDESALQSLGRAVEELAKRLTDDGRRRAVPDVRSVVAWSRVLPIEGVTAFVTLLAHESAERRAGAVVDVLKYPTTVGQTTGILLDALRSDGAPGPEAGLDANLSWVAKAYPSIDLDGPPACPPPLRPGLVCPSPSQ